MLQYHTCMITILSFILDQIINRTLFGARDNTLMKTGWLVYILRLSDMSLYTGITNNLPARIKQHETGKGSKYVRAHLPLTLVYSEPALNKSVALRREIEIKKLSHLEKMALISKQ